MYTHTEQVITGITAGVASVAYLGQQLKKLAGIVKFVTDLPAEHKALLASTAANTAAIASLTGQVSQLTSDVAKLVPK